LTSRTPGAALKDLDGKFFEGLHVSHARSRADGRLDLHQLRATAVSVFDPAQRHRTSAVGTGVKHVKEGDRVGVPWLHTACGHCEHCITGWETLCDHQQMTGYTVNGGYAEYVLADPGYVGHLPANVGFTEIAGRPAAGRGGAASLSAESGIGPPAGHCLSWPTPAVHASLPINPDPRHWLQQLPRALRGLCDHGHRDKRVLIDDGLTDVKVLRIASSDDQCRSCDFSESPHEPLDCIRPRRTGRSTPGHETQCPG